MTVVGGVPRSGEEIQAALAAFVTRWKNYQGTEKSGAQTFLNELFECYGTSRADIGARFEDSKASAGFMDLHWPQGKRLAAVWAEAGARRVGVGTGVDAQGRPAVHADLGLHDLPVGWGVRH